MASVRITADTNIFYNLSSGTMSKNQIVYDKEELWATPVNIIEIVSGIDEESWKDRKNVANAILKYADNIAEDPNWHLAMILGAKPPENCWREIVQIVAEAKSISEIKSEVTCCKDFRKRYQEDFFDRMVSVCNKYIDDYANAMQDKKPVKKLMNILETFRLEKNLDYILSHQNFLQLFLLAVWAVDTNRSQECS